MGSSPPAAAAPHRDTASRPGQHCEDAAMCCCGASLDAGFSSTRLADLCLCADAPRAVASVCWPQTGRLLVSHGSRSKSRPPVPAQACHEPCTPCCTVCRTHSAACPSLPGTQGPRPARRPDSAVRRRAAVHAVPLHRAQELLRIGTSIPSGTRDSFQQPWPARQPALGCTPTRISQSDMYHAPYGHLCTA